MEQFVVNRVGRAKRRTLNGRSYLVAPLTLIVPGVLPGSNGPLLYTAEDTSRNASAWNRVPITLFHPFDPITNEAMLARDEGVLDRQGLGFVSNAMFLRGALRGEGWFDEERTKYLAPEVYNALLNGTPVELSTGLGTRNEPNPGTFNGRPYHSIAREHQPDHLAVLPGMVGACSVMDGCGVNMNAMTCNCGGAVVDGKCAKCGKTHGTQNRLSFWHQLGALIGMSYNEESVAPPTPSFKRSAIPPTPVQKAAEERGQSEEEVEGKGKKPTENEWSDAARAAAAEARKASSAAHSEEDDPRTAHGEAAEAHFAAGSAYTKEGGHKEAEQHYEKAREHSRKAAGLEVGSMARNKGTDPGETMNWVQTLNKEFGSDDERKAAFAAMADSDGPTGAAGKASTKANKEGTSEAHKSASDAHVRAAVHHEEAGNADKAAAHKQAAKFHAKAMKASTTNEFAKALVENCTCDKTRKALRRAIANVQGVTGTAGDTVRSGGDGGDEGQDGEYEDEETFSDKGKKQVASPKKTMNEMLKTASQEDRDTWQYSQEIVKRAKAGLVRRLTANVRDEAKRVKAASELMKKTYPELEQLAELFPVRNEAAAAGADDAEPMYLGASSVENVANGGDQEIEYTGSWPYQPK